MFAIRKLVPLLLCVWITAGCSVIGTIAQPTKDSSTLALMPNLSNYTRSNTTDLKSALASAVGGASALTGNLEITALVAAADRLTTCYSNAGAYEAYTYINTSDVTKTGLILIINNNAVKDLRILLSCLNPNKGGSSAASVQPCTNSFTITTATNSYQVFYAASDISVCNDFCNAMSGCIRH